MPGSDPLPACRSERGASPNPSDRCGSLGDKPGSVLASRWTVQDGVHLSAWACLIGDLTKLRSWTSVLHAGCHRARCVSQECSYTGLSTGWWNIAWARLGSAASSSSPSAMSCTYRTSLTMRRQSWAPCFSFRPRSQAAWSMPTRSTTASGPTRREASPHPLRGPTCHEVPDGADRSPRAEAPVRDVCSGRASIGGRHRANSRRGA